MALSRELGRLAVALGARALPSAVTHAALVYFLVESWKEPYRFGPRAPYDILAIWLFEFLFLHSFPFFVLLAGHRRVLAGLAVVYGGFALAIGLSLDTTVLLVFFGVHVLIWLIRGWKAQDKAQKQMEAFSASEEGVRMWLGYATAFALYLAAVAVAAIAPVPELGWGAAPNVVRGDQDTPFIIAATTVYFTGRLLQDLFSMTWGRTLSAKELLLGKDG